PVPEAAYGFDRGRVRIGPAELAAQPQNGELDPLLADPGRVVPRLAEQLVGGQDGAGVTYQGIEQPELGRGQAYLLAVDEDAALGRVEVEHPVVVHLVGPGGRVARSPQQRLDPGQQLSVGEGLGEVVVGAAAQPADLVRLLAVRGEDQHRYVADVAQPLQDRPAVHLRQPDVEDDQVGMGGVRLAEPGAPVPRMDDVVAGAAEEQPQRGGDVRIVLDHEQPAHVPALRSAISFLRY